MPDKRYVKGCGKSCTRCWRNRLNHGSKLKKKCFPKFFDFDENKEKKYATNMEEFLDKYVEIDTNNIENDNNDYNKDNRELLNLLTQKYNNWLCKDKNITKKIKPERVIKLIQDAVYFNDKSKYILNACKPNQNENENYNKKYVIFCNYKE